MRYIFTVQCNSQDTIHSLWLVGVLKSILIYEGYLWRGYLTDNEAHPFYPYLINRRQTALNPLIPYLDNIKGNRDLWIFYLMFLLHIIGHCLRWREKEIYQSLTKGHKIQLKELQICLFRWIRNRDFPNCLDLSLCEFILDFLTATFMETDGTMKWLVRLNRHRYPNGFRVNGADPKYPQINRIHLIDFSGLWVCNRSQLTFTKLQLLTLL